MATTHDVPYLQVSAESKYMFVAGKHISVAKYAVFAANSVPLFPVVAFVHYVNNSSRGGNHDVGRFQSESATFYRAIPVDTLPSQEGQIALLKNAFGRSFLGIWENMGTHKDFLYHCMTCIVYALEVLGSLIGVAWWGAKNKKMGVNSNKFYKFVCDYQKGSHFLNREWWNGALKGLMGTGVGVDDPGDTKVDIKEVARKEFLGLVDSEHKFTPDAVWVSKSFFYQPKVKEQALDILRKLENLVPGCTYRRHAPENMYPFITYTCVSDTGSVWVLNLTNPDAPFIDALLTCKDM